MGIRCIHYRRFFVAATVPSPSPIHTLKSIIMGGDMRAGDTHSIRMGRLITPPSILASVPPALPHDARKVNEWKVTEDE